MPNNGAKSKLSQQEKILNLFNKLVVPKQDLNSLEPVKRAAAIYGLLDEQHMFDDPIRIQLQNELGRIKPGEFDPNQVLTDGPLKGSTITWVCAYIAASQCSFPQDNSSKLGYSYFLNRIITISKITGVDLTASFKATTLRVSALWLTIYSDIRNLKITEAWFTHLIISELKSEQLRKLNINTLGKGDDNIAFSVLAMWIKADYYTKESYDFIHNLLKKVSPLDFPDFYNFNQAVLDSANMGMTTLCFAAQLEADAVKKDIPISERSAFFSILNGANIQTLDLNARIRSGINKGKSPLWYAAYIATTQVFENLDTIIEKSDLDLLDFNAKAEDAGDDDANASVLWLASFALVNYRHGYPLLTILRRRKDLSTLDFNNCPTSNKDGEKGKSVFWQCARAALNGKKGDDEALLIILNNREKLKLDYTAKAESGLYANKTVSDLIIKLAQKGNVWPLVKMLQDDNRPAGIEREISPLIWANMCSQLKTLSLEDDDSDDFKNLQEAMFRLNIRADHLSANVPCGEFTGQTALMILIDLALAGFPKLLMQALQSVDITHILNTELKSETRLLLFELKRQCAVAAMEQHDDNITILNQFLSGKGHSAQDYVQMLGNVDTLLKQFSAFRFTSDVESVQQEFDEKLKFTPN